MTIFVMAGLGLVTYSLLIRGGTSVPLVDDGRVVPDTDLVPFGTVALAQPPGTRIAAMAVADRRLFLWLKDGEQEERIILVDFATGRTLGTITVSSTQIRSIP